jgi:hypothetical protein
VTLCWRRRKAGLAENEAALHLGHIIVGWRCYACNLNWRWRWRYLRRKRRYMAICLPIKGISSELTGGGSVSFVGWLAAFFGVTAGSSWHADALEGRSSIIAAWLAFGDSHYL